MAKRLKEGLVQIYTGDGKGKTTAAFGAALRASGAGLRVCICQFAKGKTCSEAKALTSLRGVRVYQCGRACFIKGRPSAEDKRRAEGGLAEARKIMASGEYSLVILDEINIALKLGLLRINDIVDIIGSRPRHVEMILTGRDCPKALFKYADLVTEMREVKHPYRKGVLARRGIEY